MSYVLALFIFVAGGVATYYPPDNRYPTLDKCEQAGEAALTAREEAKGYPRRGYSQPG